MPDDLGSAVDAIVLAIIEKRFKREREREHLKMLTHPTKPGKCLHEIPLGYCNLCTRLFDFSKVLT